MILRLLREFTGIAASIALLAAAGLVGNFDVAEQYRIEAEEKDARPVRAREYYRELLCDCLKQNGKASLRHQVVHQRDRSLCKAKCIYDDGTITNGTL